MLPNNDYQNLVQFQEAVFNRYNGCDDSDQRTDIEKYNQPVRKELVRRDSGNWSGDRNSASSSSSTSLENPYHYIIGKMHLRYSSNSINYHEARINCDSNVFIGLLIPGVMADYHVVRIKPVMGLAVVVIAAEVRLIPDMIRFRFRLPTVCLCSKR